MLRNLAPLGMLALAVAGLVGGEAVNSPGPAGPRSALTQTESALAAVPASRSFRFAKQVGHARHDESTPIQLTASDGTGLALVALEANGVLEPPLAFTELHLTFENPRSEVIEGRFRITLPPGAAISRFAMKIGDAWQEGEVVERQRARVAYEDFLHRRQDPALLEQEAGNEFSARVFPIPARAKKELIVSYSHALARSDETYVLPLLGLSQIGRLDVQVFLGDRPGEGVASNLGGEVKERRVVELHKRDWTPDRDFEIRQEEVARRTGLRHGNLTVARVAAPVEAVPQEIAGLYVLFDTSASRALGYRTQVERLAQLVAGLRDGAGGGTPLAVAAFDQEVASVFEGRADGFGADEIETLGLRRPLGASNLHQALSWLGRRLDESRERYPRVLLVTDGVATAGETEARKLKAAVSALGKRGVERVDALAVGGLRDQAALRELVTGNLKHDGQVVEGGAPLAEIGRRLTLACRSGIKVTVEGASWVWPETLDGVQPGDETLIFADLPAGRPLRLALNGKAWKAETELAPAERPLLERAWAQARIERLLHLRESALSGDDDLRKALQHQIVELSVKHRVLSPYTALLVLETEADYARFNLDRRSLADILTVGPGGLDVLARRRPAFPEVTQPRKQELQALGYVDGAEADVETSALAEAFAEGDEVVVDGMETGVAGGVPGGVVGGTPGGVVSGEAPRSAPPPARRMARAEPELPADIPEPVPAEPEEQAAPALSIPQVAANEERRREVEGKASNPYTGRFGEVMADLAAGRSSQARAAAETWISESPGDVLALLALGEVWETAGETSAAARAYGSLIDLFPGRVDLRRLAGERLERLGDAGIELAIDTYRKAVEDRPDHPTGHRLLAWALLRAGRFEEAFAALERGLDQSYPQGRFAGLDTVLREDLGLLGAAWLNAEPTQRHEIFERLEAHGARLSDEPSLRFVLSWETDANDVDLHIHDREGGHAYYGHKQLESGGALVADVTTGYGPECFAARGSEEGKAAPYRLRVHYYRRGPMGYGMGIVQIVRHDGQGRLTVEPRPFVVMADGAMIDLGKVGSKAEG